MKLVLKITSVLQIVGGVLSLILAVLMLVGGGLTGAAAGGTTGDTQAAAILLTGMVVIVGILMLISGVFGLICGIFGWKGAAGDESKLKKAIVCGWIMVALQVMSAIAAFTSKSESSSVLNIVISFIVPVLYLVSAIQVKNGAN